MELLFSRLAPGPRRRAIAQVARWATTTTLASVADEASVVVHAAVNADPALVCELLLLPLLGRLEDELASAAAAGSDQLSKVRSCRDQLCKVRSCRDHVITVLTRIQGRLSWRLPRQRDRLAVQARCRQT